MNAIIQEKTKAFTAGLADNKAYMMEMSEAKPIMEKKDDNLFIIDIRPEAVYKKGHIPGSFNFPLANIVDKVEEIPQNKTILVVCTLDAMSAYATLILHMFDHKATLVKGGVPAWKEAGGTLEIA